MLWNTAYFYPKIKWPSKIQVCQTQQRQTAAAGGDRGLRCAGGPQSIQKLERRYGNSPNNLVSVVVVICRTSVERVQSRSVSNAHGSSLMELPQHRFSRFCSTRRTELSLFAFGWKRHARHCGQSWQMRLWARCWTRWPSPADEVQWFDVTKFHSALKAVVKICVGFVDILRRAEFLSLRIFGTTEVVVGHPLGTERAQVVRTSKPTYLLAWLIPCGLAQALLQKCTYKDISPSRQAVVFLGIFNMGVLSRTFIISSETKKFPKPDCLLEFPEGP